MSAQNPGTVIGYKDQASLNNARATGDTRLNASNSHVISPTPPTPLGTPTGGTPKFTPVITSAGAKTDFTNKQDNFNNLKNDIANQSANVANNKSITDAQTQAQTDKAQTDKLANDKAASDKAANDAKIAALTGQISGLQTKATDVQNAGYGMNDQIQYDSQGKIIPKAPTTDTTQVNPSQNTQDYVKNLQGMQDERTSAFNTFMQTANSMIVGLQTSESALVSATTQQFQSIIQAQTNANASNVGAATETAARSGQEYTPAQASGTITAAITAGNQRLSEINSDMAKTIADLEVNFQKEEYSMINDNYAKLDKNFTDRMKTFSDIHDVIAKDASDQLKAKQDARDFEYKKGQDEILNNLNSAKFSYQQKQDAIDNAFKSKQISETQRHNLAQEAIAKDPTPAEVKATNEALQNAKASIPVMQDKVTSIDNLKNAPGMQSRVGTSFLSRKVAPGEGFFGKLGVGVAETLKAPLTLGFGSAIDLADKVTGQGQDFAAGVHKLVNGLTLQNLIDAKKAGATFGALSEGELSLLASSASTLNDWEIKDSKGQGTGVWNIDEGSFKKELDNIKTLTNRALLLSQGHLISPDEQKQLDSSFPTSEDPSIYY